MQGRSGVPDHTTVQQGSEVEVELRNPVRRVAGSGEEHVSTRTRVVVAGSDPTMLDPHLAPATRPSMVPLAFTERPWGREENPLLDGDHGEIVPGVLIDPLQEMESAGIDTRNTFRTPPEPWDAGLYHE